MCFTTDRLFTEQLTDNITALTDQSYILSSHHCYFDIIEETNSCCRFTGLYCAYNEFHVCCKWRAVFQCVLYSVGLSRGHWGLSVAVIWFTGGRISEGQTLISCLPLCLSSVIQMCFHLEESLCSLLHRLFLYLSLFSSFSSSSSLFVEPPAPSEVIFLSTHLSWVPSPALSAPHRGRQNKLSPFWLRMLHHSSPSVQNTQNITMFVPQSATNMTASDYMILLLCFKCLTSVLLCDIKNDCNKSRWCPVQCDIVV